MEYSQKLTSHISKTKYIQNSSCDFNAAKLETNNLKKLPSLRPKELKQSNKKKGKKKEKGRHWGTQDRYCVHGWGTWYCIDVDSPRLWNFTSGQSLESRVIKEFLLTIKTVQLKNKQNI